MIIALFFFFGERVTENYFTTWLERGMKEQIEQEQIVFTYLHEMYSPRLNNEHISVDLWNEQSLVNFLHISHHPSIYKTPKQAYLIIVIFFTLTKFLENKIYTEKLQFFALNL